MAGHMPFRAKRPSTQALRTAAGPRCVRRTDWHWHAVRPAPVVPVEAVPARPFPPERRGRDACSEGEGDRDRLIRAVGELLAGRVALDRVDAQAPPGLVGDPVRDVLVPVARVRGQPLAGVLLSALDRLLAADTAIRSRASSRSFAYSSRCFGVQAKMRRRSGRGADTAGPCLVREHGRVYLHATDEDLRAAMELAAAGADR